MNQEDHYGVIPILMIGDSTSDLLAAIVDDPEFIAYSLKHCAGVDFFLYGPVLEHLRSMFQFIKTVELLDKTFKLQFLDISKQEQFKFLRSKFKPYAKIIVYNATAMESFEKARMFLEENDIYPKECLLLVGYDSDLDDNDEIKVVKRGTAEELASMFEITFIETSANDPTNLDKELLKMTAYIESSKIYKTGAVRMEG